MQANEEANVTDAGGIADGVVPETVAEADMLAARGGLYALLGRCLEAEADAGLIETFRGPLREAVEELGLDPGKDVMEGPVEDVLEALAEEFTALFVAPGAACPYRSVFETGRLFQPQADRALEAYRAAGFEFAIGHSGEFADHAGIMLAFVARLCDREAEALRRGDDAAAEDARARRERFLVSQLGPWVIGWSRRARAASRHPFYSGVLGLVEQAVWEDVAAIADAATLRRLAVSNKRPLVRPGTDPEFRKASGL